MLHIDPRYADKSDYHTNYHFEQGVVKLQRNMEDALTDEERDAVNNILQ